MIRYSPHYNVILDVVKLVPLIKLSFIMFLLLFYILAIARGSMKSSNHLDVTSLRNIHKTFAKGVKVGHSHYIKQYFVSLTFFVEKIIFFKASDLS